MLCIAYDFIFRDQFIMQLYRSLFWYLILVFHLISCLSKVIFFANNSYWIDAIITVTFLCLLNNSIRYLNYVVLQLRITGRNTNCLMQLFLNPNNHTNDALWKRSRIFHLLLYPLLNLSFQWIPVGEVLPLMLWIVKWVILLHNIAYVKQKYLILHITTSLIFLITVLRYWASCLWTIKSTKISS